MKHVTWLISAIALAGLADTSDAWVYDTTARVAEVRSSGSSAVGALESRTASSSSSTASALESRVTDSARSPDGRLDSRPPMGIYLILR